MRPPALRLRRARNAEWKNRKGGIRIAECGRKTKNRFGEEEDFDRGFNKLNKLSNGFIIRETFRAQVPTEWVNVNCF